MSSAIMDWVRSGQMHRIKLREIDSEYPTTIDYISDVSIICHISIRPGLGSVVLNQCLSGDWGSEEIYNVPKSLFASGIEVWVQIVDKCIYITIGGLLRITYVPHLDVTKTEKIDVNCEHTIEITGNPVGDQPIEDGKSRSAPSYVREVAQLANSINLRPISVSLRPDRRELGPILLSVMRNETARIPEFLKHYRQMGVARFAIVENRSEDATRLILASQPDVDLYETDEAFNWKNKQAWLSYLIDRYGRNRWYLHADADELIIIDDTFLTFSNLAAELQKANITRARGVLVDMYGGATWKPRGITEEFAPEDFNYFDAGNSLEACTKEIISCRGGVRRRLFDGGTGFCNPELTKYPLFLAKEDDVFANPHVLWPFEANFSSPPLLAILHYKFLSGSIHSFESAATEGQYWNSSAEYKRYLSVIAGNPELEMVSMHTRSGRKFADLVREGVVARMPPSLGSSAEMGAIVRGYFDRRAKLIEQSAESRSQRLVLDSTIAGPVCQRP